VVAGSAPSVDKVAEAERERTLRGALGTLGGIVFADRGAELDVPHLGGWRAGADGPNAVTVRHMALSGWEGGEVEVETSTVFWTGQPIHLVRQLLGSDRRGRPDFPYSSTVTKEPATMRVAGRRRKVALYRCGERWIITCRSAGLYVTVTGRTVDPAGIALVRLDRDAIEAAIAQDAERRAAHQRRLAGSEPR